MTLRISTAARDYINSAGSLKSAFQNGQIQIYSGTQPVSADAAPTGTLLCVITANSAVRTEEILATGTITLSGSGGSVDSVTVGGVAVIDGAVPYSTDLTVTAANLATAINLARSVPDYTATSNGAVVTITAPRGMGAGANGLTISVGVTTLTATTAALAGGVSAVNGLKFGASSGGVVSKLDSQPWSGVALASGTAGWFRFTGSVADNGSIDSTASQVRMDGAISTSGAQLNMSSTMLTSGATQTIASFPITLPSA
jgi:hypothetical protein